ncbi:hypothetical protein K440DRAFT_646768 [Wilcoxina mikolae CBS 423.85]|nr:hypothetical protein K440DRAFT_646768 [Wilcoxina mikolae CBS 423.85]
MEDSVDWEAAWSKLDSGTTSTPQRHLAATTQKSVADCRKWWGWYAALDGVLLGYEEVETKACYVLRRGTANAVDCPTVTEAQRMQIMGHARADVFRRHYMHQSVKLDTQSAYLCIGLMSAKRDPRAPVKLEPQDFKQMHSTPELIVLTTDRSRLAADLKRECGTIKSAALIEPGRHGELMKLSTPVNALKRKLERTALIEKRARWFDAVDHNEIRQQLGGHAASEFTYVKPEFHCPLRSLVSDFYVHRIPAYVGRSCESNVCLVQTEGTHPQQGLA